MNQASNDTAMAELRLRLEAHQRMLARWEAKVARQLEKIVGLQKNVSRTFSTESAPATPFPAMPGRLDSAFVLLLQYVSLCAVQCNLKWHVCTPSFWQDMIICSPTMQLHVMHSVTKVIQYCSVCATAAMMINAVLVSLWLMQPWFSTASCVST